MTSGRVPLIAAIVVGLAVLAGHPSASALGSRQTPDAITAPVEQPRGLEIVDTRGMVLGPGAVIRTTGSASPEATGTPGPRCEPGIAATPGQRATPTRASGNAMLASNYDPFQTIVGNGDFARVRLDEETLPEPILLFELTAAAGKRFYEYTSGNIGRPVAVVLDGVVLAAPIINGPIAAEGVITGPALSGS